MEIYKKQSMSESFKVYFDNRMSKILLLGAISGFPDNWKQFKSLVKGRWFK